MNIIFIVEDNGVQQEMVNIPVVQNIEPVNCETEDEEFTTINGTFHFLLFFLVSYIVL